MIRSMTGYGRAEASGGRLTVAVECRSVNHRHLDVALKLPRALSGFEADARRLVQAAVGRGRVDVGVSLTSAAGGSTTPPTVNLGQAREYADIAFKLADGLGLPGGPSVEWLLGQPGVIVRDEAPALSPEEGWALLERALGLALAEMLSRRETEGQALAKELSALHATLAAQVEIVAERAPAAVERHAARLRERIRSLLGEAPIDEARIATEVAVWAERSDITEELARLRAHLDQFTATLGQGQTVGRALDFLLQELNREVNTVGSKADDLEITQTVIAAKGVLEKLREQAQNIE